MDTARTVKRSMPWANFRAKSLMLLCGGTPSGLALARYLSIHVSASAYFAFPFSACA